MSKAKIIGWVIASPFILIAGGIAFCEANKAYWDHKVKQWCEKDGGVTVHEKVELTKEEYENLKIPFEGNSNNSAYFYRLENFVINDDNPKVSRGEQSVVRRSDSKKLGSLVRYGRSGGDIIPIDHPTHYGCEDIESINIRLTNSIFFN